jgi:branched-chain amino acid transport system substrate-binding protein
LRIVIEKSGGPDRAAISCALQSKSRFYHVAGTYGAVTHYLKSVAAAGSVDGPVVAAKMREIPVNDFMTKDGRIREDGRLVRDMYLFKVKSPEQSRYKFDYYQLLATIPGNEAFKPQEEGGCPLLSKK